MKITNKHNLPESLENFAKKTLYEPKENSFSATTLLLPTREIILKKRHFNELEVDCSEMVWMLFGTAVHSILEHSDQSGKAETYLKEHIKDGYYLTGKADLYNEETQSLEDWKTASVYKVKIGDFNDWKMQGLIYTWLFRQKGIYLENIKFHALLKDWVQREARLNKDYPQSPIYTYQYKCNTQDMIDIEKYIRNRFGELIAIEKGEKELPLCTEEERWYTGDKYAVMKDNQSKALRVLDTLTEAEGYLKYKGGDYIQKRIGESRKCLDYCSCNKVCDYYKKLKGEL